MTEKRMNMMIETERLRIYPAPWEQMETMIASEQDEERKKTYTIT